MKFYILILASILFVSCANPLPIDNTAKENLKEKNKETIAKNEITKIITLAQQIELQGRDLRLFRESPNAESIRQCNLIVEEKRKQTADLETRIKNLTENDTNKLMPIIGELNDCLSCTKDTLNTCKKARESINQAIKETYP